MATQGTFDGYSDSANRLLEMAVSERPQARLSTVGPSGLSDSELLALVLGGSDPVKVARAIVAQAGSVAGLLSWTTVQFEELGVPSSAACRLVAVMEIARRAVPVGQTEAQILNRADLIAEFMMPKIAGLEVEKFWVLALNRRNRLRKCIEVSSGTATAALAHPREVFRAAIRESACAVVCVHNHPGGDPSPSAADIQLTRQLREAAGTVDIPLLDHVICGRHGADPLGRGYYSFREAGLI